MDVNKLLRNYLNIGIGTLLTVAIQGVTAPVITRLVSPEDYGVQAIFVSFCTVVFSVICFGLDQSYLRWYYVDDSMSYKSSLLKKCLGIVMGIYVTLSLIMVIFRIILKGLKYEWFFIICALIYVAASLVDRFLFLTLRMDYRTKEFSAVNVLSKLVFLITTTGLVFCGINNSKTLVFCSVISVLSSSIINIVLNRKILGTTYSNLKQPSNKELIKYGMPFILSYGIGAFFSVIDRMSIKYFGTYNDVGIYASAINLVGVFTIIQSTFSSLWSPTAFEHYEKDPSDRSFYVYGYNIVSAIVFLFGFVLVLGKDLLIILLGEEYREAAYLLPFLALNPIMMTVSETTVSGLYFMKKSKYQIVPPLCACVTNIIGNLISIPAIGYRGAAISTGISYIVLFAIRTALGQYFFPMGLSIIKFFVVTVVFLICALYSTYNTFSLGVTVLCLFGITITLIIYKNTMIVAKNKLCRSKNTRKEIV